MIHMKLSGKVVYGPQVSTNTLSEDKESKYPTGLYVNPACPEVEEDWILYFGRGVWVRNQEACNMAVYDVVYKCPVTITLNEGEAHA